MSVQRQAGMGGEVILHGRRARATPRRKVRFQSVADQEAAPAPARAKAKRKTGARR
jgi:hypothetical protein